MVACSQAEPQRHLPEDPILQDEESPPPTRAEIHIFVQDSRIELERSKVNADPFSRPQLYPSWIDQHPVPLYETNGI